MISKLRTFSDSLNLEVKFVYGATCFLHFLFIIKISLDNQGGYVYVNWGLTLRLSFTFWYKLVIPLSLDYFFQRITY